MCSIAAKTGGIACEASISLKRVVCGPKLAKASKGPFGPVRLAKASKGLLKQGIGGKSRKTQQKQENAGFRKNSKIRNNMENQENRENHGIWGF